ncbi:polyprotein [aichivirus A5]|uniref:Genome polyprotein n=1 Tax=aichivirus A5 TaxID=2870388 RepID=A0A076YJH3_AIV|nr:polyprotein [aichivirus A5]
MAATQGNRVVRSVVELATTYDRLYSTAMDYDDSLVLSSHPHLSYPLPKPSSLCLECHFQYYDIEPMSWEGDDYDHHPCPKHRLRPKTWCLGEDFPQTKRQVRLVLPPEDILWDSDHVNWFDDEPHPTDWQQAVFDQIALLSLPGPKQAKTPQQKKKLFHLLSLLRTSNSPFSLPLPTNQIQRQGQSVTNIYGNGNNVTTDTGANGWSPTVNTGLGDGPVSSSQDQLPGRAGGASGAKDSSPSTGQNRVGSRYSKWWEPAAARALERATDTALDGIEGAGKVATKAISKKLDGSSTASPQPSLIALNPSATQSGNAAIMTGSTAPSFLAYPQAESVPLPNPDDPSKPGPSGDRTWLLDTVTWDQSQTIGWNLAGPNGMQWTALESPQFPISNSTNWGTQLLSAPTAYPLPASFVRCYPDSPWAAMYDTHSMWNCGWRVQVTVNGSQFHSGALILFMIPEATTQAVETARFDSLFVYPYVIVNLYESTTATIEVPYISPTPNTSSALHHPWTFYLSVLTPLTPPTGMPTSLSCSIYVTPVDSTFHGLRYVAKQHWKTREVPGTGAFGSAVAGQEIPLFGVKAYHPPRKYLPAPVHDWLEFAARPGLMKTLNWTQADDAGHQLALLPVSPAAIAGTGAPISYVLSLFSQWRGELAAHLLFTGSAQHYGRVVVCYTPAAPTPPSTMQEAMRGTYTVWDVNSASTLEFTIPFISQSYWKTVDIWNPDALLSTTGFLSVWVQNPLTGPTSSPPSAQIQCFLSGGESFNVRFMQNPALTSQGETADGLKAGQDTANIEMGASDNTPQERTTFQYTENPNPPDSNLQNFFSFYRLLPLGDGTPALSLSLQSAAEIPLDPIHWLSNADVAGLSSMLSCFTYIAADLRLTLRIGNPNGIPCTLLLAYAPPGATLPRNPTRQYLSNFFMAEVPCSADQASMVSFSVPYTFPLSAIPTSYYGWEDWSGTNFGILSTGSWGTLILLPEASSSVPADTPLSITCWLAFGNFQGWVPRAPPPLPSLPSPQPTPITPSQQGGAKFTLGDVDPDDDVYVIRCSQPTYVHWAIRKVTADGSAKQISLSREGTTAWCPMNPSREKSIANTPQAWTIAELQLGDKWDYSATNNCTHYVERATGLSLPNTGYSLALGIGALAVASTSVVAVQALTGIRRQGLLTLTADADTNRTLNAISDSVKSATQAVSNLDLHGPSQNITLAASDVREAATKVAASLDGFTEVLSDVKRSLSSTVSSAVECGVISFLTWLSKVFGYLLVLFGSPTPMSVAGVLVIIVADLAPHAKTFFTQSGNVVSALYFWKLAKHGLQVTPEECEEQALQQQGIRDFNDGALALRNVEWIGETCWKWAQRVLEWIRGKAKEDPQAQLDAVHDEILSHYSDSILALGTEKPPKDFLVDAMTRVRELIPIAQAAKSGPHSQFLNQALRNYTQALSNARKRQSRPSPESVVVYFYGPPGTGKSMLASLLAQTLAQKLSGSPDDVYSPTSASCEYFDGYTGQVVHFIDDIGQDPEGRDWANFPNLVSSAPFIVPMASLEEKGTHYTSKVIVVTSNFHEPNDRAARSMAALRRRVHLRINVGSNGVPFDPVNALNPIPGTQSKYFHSQTPLTLFQTATVRVDRDSVWTPTFTNMDELVDAIVMRLDRSTGVSNSLASLIKRQGKTITAEPTEIPMAFADELTEALAHHKPVPVSLGLSQAISINTPLKQISDTLWKYRKPIFATTTFLAVVGFLCTLIPLARSIWKAKEDTPEEAQAAYSGIPRQKNKTQKAPKPVPTRHIQRQGLSPALPGIANNVVSVASGCPGEEFRMSGFYIFSRFLLIPTHLREPHHTHLMVGVDKYDWATLRTQELGELTIVHTPTSRQYKDMRRFIGSYPYETGILVSQFKEAPLYIRISDNRIVDLDFPGIVVCKQAYGYRCASFEGLCGSPLTTDDPAGIKILGLHVAGVAGTSGFSAPIHTILSEITAFALQQQSLIVPTGCVRPGVNVNRQSRLKPSPAYGAFPIKKEPAPLKRGDHRLEEGIVLDKQLFLKHGKGDMTEPWPGLEAAADLYFSTFPSKLPVLSQQEAISGTPNMEGLDMAQASGYPWNTMGRSTRSLFLESEPGVYVPTPELQQKIDETLENPDNEYSTFLKDELRPTAKVVQGLTRIVEAAPIHAIVAGRMLLGGLIDYMQGHPGRHGSAVGCNPDVHWTEFFFKFSEFSQVYDLDYKCFDATLPTAAFEVVARHLERLTGDPRVASYIRSIAHSIHIYGDQTYEMIGGNPSGCVATSILNTIINNICVLSALIQHSDFSPSKFQILAYGDDVIYATEPPIHPSWIREFYERCTPLVVTPANKTQDFPPTSTIYEVTFLKRWFVPDDKRPYFIHPVMDPDTYEQSVMWLRDGDFQDVVTSLCHLAFHAGPKTYAAWCTKVREQCLKSGFAPNFLPYSYLQLRWLNMLSV